MALKTLNTVLSTNKLHIWKLSKGSILQYIYIYFPALQLKVKGDQRVSPILGHFRIPCGSCEDMKTPLFFCFLPPSLLSPPSFSFEARHREGSSLLATNLQTKPMDAHLCTLWSHVQLPPTPQEHFHMGSLTCSWPLLSSFPSSWKQVCQMGRESLYAPPRLIDTYRWPDQGAGTRKSPGMCVCVFQEVCL